MKNNTPEEIWNKIKESDKILLSLHTEPDGDSLGSCTAMKCVLEKMNKQVKLISYDSLSKNLNDLEFSKEVEFGIDITEINLKDHDLLITMDTGTPQMIGKYKEGYKIPKEIFTINIDHHITNSRYGDLNYVKEKSSACSVLLEILRKINFNIDKEIATRLLAGIYTDTGYFSHEGKESLNDAAFLVNKGVDYVKEIVNKIKYNIPLNVKKYYALLYDNLKITEIGKYKIGHSSTSLEDIKKLKLNLSEVRGGINELQEVGEIDIFFTLNEREKNIKGSFRTRKNVDVSKLANELGGGGHRQAAAFVLPKMSIEQAENRVLETIKHLL